MPLVGFEEYDPNAEQLPAGIKCWFETHNIRLQKFLDIGDEILLKTSDGDYKYSFIQEKLFKERHRNNWRMVFNLSLYTELQNKKQSGDAQ